MATVLVVDDTASIRTLIRLNLELAGHTVVEAFDGQDCIDKLPVVRPDCITMDLMMPRVNGMQAIDHIRSDRSLDSVAIVMVTTQQQHFDVSRASRAGVDDYVTKPFNPDTLVQAVDKALQSRSKLD